MWMWNISNMENRCDELVIFKINIYAGVLFYKNIRIYLFVTFCNYLIPWTLKFLLCKCIQEQQVLTVAHKQVKMYNYFQIENVNFFLAIILWISKQ